MRLGQRFASRRIDLLLTFRFVGLVCHKHLADVGQRVLVNLVEPVLDIIEGYFFCAVIHKNDAHRPFVISLSNCSESLLACSVPDLQLDHLVIQLYSFDPEIDSDGWHVAGGKLVVRETKKETSFTDA